MFTRGNGLVSLVLGVISPGENVIASHFVFGIKFLIDHHIFRKHRPLICGLTVTDRCNLNCRHCNVANRGLADLTYREAVDALNSFYKEGGRTVYIQGGELFIWRDGEYRLENIVAFSKSVDFYTTPTLKNRGIPLFTSLIR